MTDLKEPQEAAGPSPQARTRLSPANLVQRAGAWPALVVLLIVSFVFARETFFHPANLADIFRLASILGIVTLGQVLVLMTAGIDLSVGAVVGITAVAIAEAGAGRVSLPAALAAAVAIAIVVGLTNGLLVSRRRVPPVVATFGMFVTLEGLRIAYTRGSASGNVPEALLTLGQSRVLGVPTSTWVWVILTIILAVGARRLMVGRRFVMTGANERMAMLSGISVGRMKVSAYVTCSLLAVVAGAFFAGYIGYVDRFIGRGTDLDSITAALLGGTTFTGGQGSFVNAAGGALLITALLNLILVTGLNIEFQLVAKGLVLILAVALHTLPKGSTSETES